MPTGARPSPTPLGRDIHQPATRPGGEEFHRAIQLVATLSAAPGSAGRAAILTNMLDVISRGSAEDYERTASLGARLGVRKVAGVQSELDSLVGAGPGVPFATVAITKLARSSQIRDAVLGAGRSAMVSRRIAAICADTAFWVLIADIDASHPGHLPESAAELRQIVERRGADAWREIVARLAANPWGPAERDLADLARAAGLEGPAVAIERCLTVFRDRIAEAERVAVAKEIRRLVAVSGCTQRKFAEYVGTSAPRLSSYITGSVTPSAAMMLRISRQSSTLAERAPWAV